MATSISKSAALTKADYLKRYLSNDDDGKKSKENKIKKKRPKPTGTGMKIVDDDIDWRQLAVQNEEENKEEDEEEAPVIAEVIDERPEDVKQLEAFRTSNKWKVMGGHKIRHDSPESSPVQRSRHDSPDLSPKRLRHDSPDLSAQRKGRHHLPDLSPQRRGRHDSPDLSPKRDKTNYKNRRHDSSSPSPPRKSNKGSPSRIQRQHNKESLHRKKTKVAAAGDLSPPRRRARTGKDSDSDQSPPRRHPHGRQGADSDLSPPRKRGQRGRGSDSDLSPPRKKPQGGRGSDSDLSPPRRTRSPDGQGPRMLSGGAAGLVSVDVLRKEQEEIRRREKHNKPLEEESRNAETIFRDKSGRKRDLESERVELKRKAGEKAEKDENYAQWGRGLAQGEMQQQNLDDAIREAQKPLARHIDDEDLDRMLREQEREGDPMAAMLRRKKEKNAQSKGIKEKPTYKGPLPPPNRFNLMPGYRWDGVDRSNGFEQKRYSRIADKKAVEEMAYKWSVEDM
ncbi:hypothetical protein IRJ41_013446 [Triplophysa rosa]|uniref:BUD13 homolog n=1 Tax=Triplophysa rosa TaxID=992332 RepID=A0A9W7THF1_TRIRA|nr:hypothetical protein IRJ41_013446 [Triplophysa rosa]